MDPTSTGVQSGSECYYTEWTSPTDVTQTATGFNTAMCGLNMDKLAWCPMLKGDPTFVDAWAVFTGVVQDGRARTLCNPSSRGPAPSNGCQALLDEMPRGFAIQYS